MRILRAGNKVLKAGSRVLKTSVINLPVFPVANLLAHFNFENNVLDSFSIRHGTNVSAVTYGAGYNGQAIIYNGASNNYTTFPVLNITGVQPWTVACWVKISGAGTYSVCGFGTESLNRAPFLFVAAGKVRFDYHGSGVLMTGATSVNSNTWRHIAWKYTGTHLHIYVDGLPDTAPIARVVNNGNNYFWIGKVYTGAGTAVMNGSIDHFSVFNADLTDAEILNLAAGALYP